MMIISRGKRERRDKETREKEREVSTLKNNKRGLLPWSSDPTVSGPPRSSFTNSTNNSTIIYVYSFSNNAFLCRDLVLTAAKVSVPFKTTSLVSLFHKTLRYSMMQKRSVCVLL